LRFEEGDAAASAAQPVSCLHNPTYDPRFKQTVMFRVKQDIAQAIDTMLSLLE
jgi:hypothetical protein